MILTNRQRGLIELLKNRFKKYQSNDIYENILLAIEIIESYNRNVVWRIFEYCYLSVVFLLYPLNHHIENISIGKYQLKISFILDYLNVTYNIFIRKIEIVDYHFSTLFLIMKERNNKNVLQMIVEKEKYNFYQSQVIDFNKLKYFLEEYSRNNPFDDGFNYFFILKELVGL